MRGYVITLFLIAFLVGSLFQAAEETGMRIWNMFATMGIFLFGLAGSLAIGRLQAASGLSRAEAALQALEPEWVITDWSGSPGERPDYVLVGPGRVAAVCVDETPGSAPTWWARRLIGRSARRAERAAGWVRRRLGELPGGEEVPVRAYLLLTRRRALSEYSTRRVAVLNPEDLAGHLPAEGELPVPLRFRFTRLLRGEEGAKTGPVGRAFHGALH